MISLQQRVMDRIEYVAAKQTFDVVSLPGGYANCGVLAIQPHGSFRTVVSIRYSFQAGSVELDLRVGEVKTWEFAGGTYLTFDGRDFERKFSQWQTRLTELLEDARA